MTESMEKHPLATPRLQALTAKLKQVKAMDAARVAADEVAQERPVTPAIKAGFRHGEAYSQMWYVCGKCGHRERLANLRDGPTPFGVHGACPRCDGVLYHNDWHDVIFDPTYILEAGQLTCITMPMEVRRVSALRIVRNAQADGSDMTDEYADQIVASMQDAEPWIFRWRGGLS